jgi:hypothetical protein
MNTMIVLSNLILSVVTGSEIARGVGRPEQGGHSST